MKTMQMNSPRADDQDGAEVIRQNSRVGVVLFTVYGIFYGGFMALSAFSPETMSEPLLAGVNVAVVYGFSLIIFPLALALIYMKLCQRTSK